MADENKEKAWTTAQPSSPSPPREERVGERRHTAANCEKTRT
jgi:hypothetical protein